MASQWPPVKGSAFSFPVSLRSQADGTQFVSNATLIPGDVKVSGDFGAYSNISVLPVVTPAGANKQIMVSMMTTDSNYDNIYVQFSDQTGSQWADLGIMIQTVAASWSTFGPAGTYSGLSVRLDASAIPAGAFQANSIDNIAVKAGAYSGVTVEVNNLVGNFSLATVRGIQNFSNLSGNLSALTVSGLLSAVSADVQQILGSAALATLFGSHISSVKTGQAVAGVLSTVTMTTDVSWTTNDNYNGRVIVFVGGALDNQATSINSTGGFVGFSNTSSQFAFAALTNAPVAGQKFVVV